MAAVDSVETAGSVSGKEDACGCATAAQPAMHIISKGPVFKSQIIRQAIRDFGDIIEHGPYLYGEYSDDIDEAVGALIAEGIARYVDDHRGRIGLTDYGRSYLQEFIEGGEFEDEEWEKVRRRCKA